MPKIVDKDQKKQEIIEAAIEVFAIRGIGNTRMADIAEKADISKGTIYEYFKNRDALIVETFFAMNNSIGEMVREQIKEDTSPIEKINITIDVLIRCLKDMRNDLLGLSFQLNAEAMQNKSLMDLCTIQYTKTYDEFQSFLVSTLEDGIKLKLFKSHNVDVVSRMIMSLIDGAIYHSIALNKREKMEDWFHEYVETMINLIKIDSREDQ